MEKAKDINYKELYESLSLENKLLKSDLNEKLSIIQILYNDMDELNSQLTHYKDMFSAANTNLLTNDKEVYELTELKNKVIRENAELRTRLDHQKKEIDDLAATNESNKEFINSYYKVNQIINSNSNSNSKDIQKGYE